LDGNSKAARVQQDVNSGIALGVTGTPTFFVGSQKVSGNETAQLSEIIDRHLGGS
jgi:protein-disulfide isomerase